MKKNLIALSVSISCVSVGVLSPVPAIAQSDLVDIKRRSAFYYEIGGAKPIPPRLGKDVSLRFGGDVGLGYSCGAFDPKAGFKSAINNLKGLVDDIQTSISGAIQALPFYLLQRWNPDLANLLKNYKFEIKELINVNLKSCEEIESAVAAGDDPYANLWSRFAKAEAWKKEAENNSDDIATAKQRVSENQTRVNFDWGSTQAGGPSTRPIQINKDVVGFGYNMQLGRSAVSGQAATSDKTTSLGSAFPNIRDAQDFVVDVIGDIEVRGTSKGTVETQIPPKGIHSRVDKTLKQVGADLRRVIVNNDQNALKRVHSPAMAVTLELAQVVRQLDAEEREMVMARLASEIAYAKVIHEGYVALRLLRTGKRHHTVQASPAGQQVEKSIAELQEEIDLMVEESKVRKSLVSDVAFKLIRNQETEILRAAPSGTIMPNRTLGADGKLQ